MKRLRPPTTRVARQPESGVDNSYHYILQRAEQVRRQIFLGCKGLHLPLQRGFVLRFQQSCHAVDACEPADLEDIARVLRRITAHAAPRQHARLRAGRICDLIFPGLPRKQDLPLYIEIHVHAVQLFRAEFLLSRQDLKNKDYGFTNDQSRKAWGTPWALAQMTVNEKYNRTEQALFRYSADRGSHSPYWTRTQGSNKYSANCTKSKGEIGWIRVVVQNEGCRPACYIDLEKIDITGGAGTLENPYEAVPVA